MKWTLFICGLVVGAVEAFAIVIYRDINRKEATDNIIFPMKVFSDQDATVVVSGTLPEKSLLIPTTTTSSSARRTNNNA
jgi:hypothetical protein